MVTQLVTQRNGSVPCRTPFQGPLFQCSFALHLLHHSSSVCLIQYTQLLSNSDIMSQCSESTCLPLSLSDKPTSPQICLRYIYSIKTATLEVRDSYKNETVGLITMPSQLKGQPPTDSPCIHAPKQRVVLLGRGSQHEERRLFIDTIGEVSYPNRTSNLRVGVYTKT